jgi:hypothetical protein
VNAPDRVREGNAKLFRLGKVLFSCDCKYCHNTFIHNTQGPQKFNCAEKPKKGLASLLVLFSKPKIKIEVTRETLFVLL